jgi:cellulose biosynthesis protein BcsQ
LFDINEIEAPFHNDWTTPKKKGSCRIDEVSSWIKNNLDYEYIIIDDPWSGGQLVDESAVISAGIDPTAVVLVDPTIGLELKHYQQMLDVFSR